MNKEEILSLINAIAEGDKEQADQHFSEVMKEKAFETIETVRESVEFSIDEQLELTVEAMSDDDWVHIKRSGQMHNPAKDQIMGYSKTHKNPNSGPKPKNGANTAMRIGDAKKKGYKIESVQEQDAGEE